MPLRPRVITGRDAEVLAAREGAAGGTVPDRYLSKIVKYVPVEIVAAYLAGEGVLAGISPPPRAALWVWWGFLLVLTPVWVLFATRVPGLPPARFQALVAPLAFAVWVFAMGGPFAATWNYPPAYGSLVLIASTLLFPLLETATGRDRSRPRADPPTSS